MKPFTLWTKHALIGFKRNDTMIAKVGCKWEAGSHVNILAQETNGARGHLVFWHNRTGDGEDWNGCTWYDYYPL